MRHLQNTLKQVFTKDKLMRKASKKEVYPIKPIDEARDALDEDQDREDYEEERIITLTKIGNDFFSSEEYEQALETYMKALRLISSPVYSQKLVSSEVDDNPDTTKSMKNNTFSIPSCNHSVAIRLFLNIGAVHLKRDELNTALKAFQTSLELSDQIEKETILDSQYFPESTMADSLTNLGLVYLKQNEFLLALSSFEKAKTTRLEALETVKENGERVSEDKLKNAYLLLCNLYSYIGMLNEWKGQYSNCVNAYSNALSSLKYVQGERNLEVAELLCKLSRVHCDLGSCYNEAMSCCSFALQIRKTILGKNHIDVGRTLTLVSEIHVLNNELDKALKTANTAIEIASSHINNGDDESAQLVTAIALDHIGKAHEKLENLEEAIVNNKRALKIKVSVLGFEHPSVANTLRNIADVYCKDDKYEEAITMYTEALRLNNISSHQEGGTLNKSLAETLNDLGKVYVSINELKDALKCYEKALSLAKDALYEYHPLVGKTLRNIGVVLKEMENRDEALECFRDALKIFRLAGLGVSHPDVTDTIRCMANQWKM